MPNIFSPADGKVESRENYTRHVDVVWCKPIDSRSFDAPGSDAHLEAIAGEFKLGRSIFDMIPAPLGPFTEVFPCEDGKRTCNLKELITAQSGSHHATRGCAIGADSDQMAVLDSNFRSEGRGCE
jgi:choline dehydrogenase